MEDAKNTRPAKILCYNEITGNFLRAAFCPGCWNTRIGRAFLTTKIQLIGYRTLKEEDRINGIYSPEQPHLTGCPYRKIFNKVTQ